METFLKKAILFLLATMIILIFLCGIIIFSSNNSFDYNYMYALHKQYNYLVKSNSPKIIFAGGSSNAFGIDYNMIETQFNVPAINLGLHAGMSLELSMELSMENIQPGDLVLLVLEIPAIDISTFNATLVYSAFDSKKELFLKVPKKFLPQMIEALPWYIFAKTDRYLQFSKNSTVYSGNAFDEKGYMIYSRTTCIEKIPETAEISYFNADSINLDGVAYLKECKERIESAGGTMYIISPPIMKESSRNDPSAIRLYTDRLTDLTGIPVLHDFEKYIMPMEYFYDGINHLNDIGMHARTVLLIEDIQAKWGGMHAIVQ